MADDRNPPLADVVSEWEQNDVAAANNRFPERDDLRTWSGIEVKRVYVPEDGHVRYLDKLGLPGRFPFTRGVQPTGYRAKPWTRRPITGFESAAKTNERVHQLLQSGQSGLHFVFDYPTLAGYDSDHALARGEIGVSGIPIDSIDDMRALLKGIPLADVSTSYSHWGPYILSFLLAHADEQGVPHAAVAGTTQNDVLMYYHSCPWWDLPLEANMKLFVDVVEYAVKEMPRWNPVSISGYNIRDGGCSAVQEIAFTFGDAIAYLEACQARGLSVDDVAPRFSFMVCAHMDFFEEIAKMRAMRRMWAKIIRDRFGSNDPRSQRFRFHAQTSGASLTAQQPLNNVVRGTVEAMAAVVGGAQSLHVSCFDETYGLPTETAIRVSLNTQNILAEESGIASATDPLGGSFFVEQLTDELEELAWDLLAEIDDQGGMVQASKSGWVRDQKLAWASSFQANVDAGGRTIVGVNAFVNNDAEEIAYHKPDYAAQAQQVERLSAFKAERDTATAARAAGELERAADRGDNLIAPCVTAAHAGVTLGEMYTAMRAVYGDVGIEEKQFM